MPAPLDITGISRNALAKAWVLIANLLETCTVQDNPVLGAYDASADTQAVTWDNSHQLTGLFYDDSGDNSGVVESDGSEAKVKNFLLRAQDFPSAPELTTKAQVVDSGGGVWQVSRVETPPGTIIHILHLTK